MSLTTLSTASLEEIREAAARLCRDYLTGPWKSVNAADIIVRRISGGLSNYLYYICLPEHADGNALETAAVSASPEGIEGAPSPENKIFRKIQRSQSCESSCSSIDGRGSGQRTFSEKSPHEVLLRIYGQTHGGDALEGMITESVVFALLSERNLGPKLHGIFPGGRIEEYIQARPLTTIELSDHKISMKIAEKMGEIHSLNIPMSKEPDWLWNCMDRWIKSLPNIKKTAESSKNSKELIELLAFNFYEEGKWLKTLIDATPRIVCFCHNDLQEGNILYHDAEAENEKAVSATSAQSHMASTTGSIFENYFHENAEEAIQFKQFNTSQERQNLVTNNLDCTNDSVFSTCSEDCGPNLIIIDFEYCAYNYRGFDLANHFLEWTFDYSNTISPYYYHHTSHYPTKLQRLDFIRSYLKKLHDCNENDLHYVPPTLTELEQVDEEVHMFSMLSHLFWSLWSVVNVNSNIQFSYLDYAATRLREYKQLKEKYIVSSSAS